MKPLFQHLPSMLSEYAAAYNWYVYRFPAWTEEVVLPGGRSLLVHQRRDYIEGYGTRRTWLTFSVPEMGGKQEWSEHMQPILIAISPKGDVYVAGWPSGWKQSSAYRLPRYGYVAYRWDGETFKRVPYLTIPEELRQEENLIRCIPDERLVTWQKKQTMFCDSQSKWVAGESRKIDLERMKVWAEKRAAMSNVKPLSE